MVLEELGVLHLDLQAARRDCVTEYSLNTGDLKACLHSDTPPPTRPHLLTAPKQSTPRELNIQTYEPMGVTPSQTTTACSWRSGGNLWHLFPTFYLFCSLLLCTPGQHNLHGLSCLHFRRTVGALKSQILVISSSVTWVLGIQAAVPELAGKALYPQSHFFSSAFNCPGRCKSLTITTKSFC